MGPVGKTTKVFLQIQRPAKHDFMHMGWVTELKQEEILGCTVGMGVVPVVCLPHLLDLVPDHQLVRHLCHVIRTGSEPAKLVGQTSFGGFLG